MGEANVGNPYSLGLVENCLICKLRSEGFFCQLPAPTLQAFEKIKYPTSYPQGALLFVEGQGPRGLFILCQGRVKLSVRSRDGKSLILKIAEPGEILGLHACVSGLPYDLTAQTIQPCQVNFARREDFLRFLREHGDACLQAAQHLSETCHNAYDLIRSLGLSHSAGEKLARFFLELAHDAEKGRQGLRIKLALTHEEIAQIIGTSRETATRLLLEFRRKKLASLQGSTLHIYDPAALEKLVGA